MTQGDGQNRLLWHSPIVLIRGATNCGFVVALIGGLMSISAYAASVSEAPAADYKSTTGACLTCFGDHDDSGDIDAADASGFGDALLGAAPHACSDINLDGLTNGLDIQGWFDLISVNNGSGDLCPEDPPAACCLIGGDCVEVPESQCQTADGQYFGGRPCENTICEIRDGACCVSDGTCEDGVVEADCVGTFHLTLTCQPDPCASDTSACCLLDGNCVETSQSDCTTQEGNFSQGSRCDDVACAVLTGACCFADGLCVGGLTEGTCGGTFFLAEECQGDLAITCPGDGGACCLGNGDCGIATQSECAQQKGTYFDGQICNNVTCEILEGACCFADGLCIDGLRDNTCGGTFSLGSTCQEITCDPLSGACCLNNGSCIGATETQCNEQGVQFSPNASCDDVICEVLTGVCCLFDGQCIDGLTEATCNGTFFLGEACQDLTCPGDGGACCLGSGDCVIATQSECAQQEGTYSDGQPCSHVACEVFEGACCFSDGLCVDGLRDNTCGGSFFLASTCQQIECTQPTGACCLDNGNCVVQTEALCTDQGVTFFADATCDDVACDVLTGACCMPDGECVDGLRESDCHGEFFLAQICPNTNCPQPNNTFWITNADGHWFDGTNWNTGAPPLDGTNAIIDVPLDITVSFAGGTSMPHSIQSTETIEVTSGTLEPTANGSNIQRLNIRNGSFDARGNTSIAVLDISGGNLTGTGNVNVITQFDWTGGSMSDTGVTTIAPGAILALSTAIDKRIEQGRTVNNEGAATMTDSGSLFISSGAVFNNLAGASFEVQSDAGFEYFTGNAGIFNNDGTFTKSGGANDTLFAPNVAFNNDGSVEVQSGTLLLRGGGASTGDFSLPLAAALLRFDGAIYVLDSGTSVTGDGTASLTSGSLQIDGTPVSVENFHQSSGSVNGSGELLITNRMNWTGGTQDGVGTTTIAGGGSLFLSGEFSKRIRNGRTFNNNGDATLTDTGSLFIDNGAVFNNLAGATFNVQSDADFEFFSGAPSAFNNNGALNKTGGTNATLFDTGLAFNNDGTVTVQSGLLRFSGGGSSTGSFQADANTSIEFNSSNPIFDVQPGTSLNGDGTYRSTAGTVRVDPANGLIVIRLEITGGTVDNQGTLTVLRFDQSSGVLRGGGTMNVTVQANFTGGAQRDAGTTAIDSNATLSISGQGSKRFESNRTIDNSGLTTMTGDGSVFITDGAVFNNLAGATFNVESDADFEYFSGAQGAFNNDGTFTKSGGADETQFGANIIFQNDGTVSVQSGTLRLRNGGSAGQFTIPPIDARLAFDGVGFALNQGSSVTGDGTTVLTNATLTVNGMPVTIQNLDQISGTVAGEGELLVSSFFNWTGGSQIEAGITTIPAGATFMLNSSFSKLLRSGRTFNNSGDATMTDTGSLFIDNGAVFNNLAGATFDAQSDADLEFFSGAGSAFNNAGVFTKSGGATDVDFGLAFNNDGTVSVQSGTFRLRGGGSNDGELNVGGTIDFNANTFALLPNTVVTGAGNWRASGATLEIGAGVNIVAQSFEITSGVVDADGNVTTTALTIGGGTVQGSGQVTSTGNLNWTGGAMQEGGTTTIPQNGVLNIAGALNKTLNGRTIDNQGATSLSGTGDLFITNGAVFNNLAGATFDVQSDAGFGFFSGPNGAFNNFGVFIKSNGAGDSLVSSNIAFVNNHQVQSQSGGLIFSGGYTQTGGSTTLSGGNIGVGNLVLNILGGSLLGGGTVSGSALLSAHGAPGQSPGTIEFTGDLEISAAGSLNIELGGLVAGVDHDLVIVGGAVTLDGALNISLINGFEPQIGQSFDILNFDSRTGDFANYNGLTLPGGLELQPSFSANALTLSVVQP